MEIEAEALVRRSDLTAVTITDQPSYEEAVEKFTLAKNWIDKAKAFFKPIKDATHAAHKTACENERKVIFPVEAALAQTKQSLVQWDNKQEQLRREEEHRLREQAEREAEEQRLADAVHAEEMGAAPEQVDAILETPVAITAPVQAAPTYQKSSAVQMRDNWGGVCDDLFALVKAVAKDKSKIGLLQVNQPALNSMAKALKETMNIPGCRAVNNRIAASGRG